jgi:hypothetical protein
LTQNDSKKTCPARPENIGKKLQICKRCKLQIYVITNICNFWSDRHLVVGHRDCRIDGDAEADSALVDIPPETDAVALAAQVGHWRQEIKLCKGQLTRNRAQHVMAVLINM